MTAQIIKLPYNVIRGCLFPRAASIEERHAGKSGHQDASADAYAQQLQEEIDAGQNEVNIGAQMREFGRPIGSLQPRQFPTALGVLRKPVEEAT
jgi:hypothetical protein